MLRKILMCCSLLLLQKMVFAGWPVGKHQSIIGNSYSFFYSHNYYDSHWKLTSPKNNSDYFIAHTYGLYYAHGLSRRLDFISSLPYIYAMSKANNVYRDRSGFGDGMVGLAYSIENNLFTKFFTIQSSAIIPLYHNGDNPLHLGYENYGVDVTLNYTFSPKFLGTKGYIALQHSWRHYFDNNATDQFLDDATIAYVVERFNQFQFNIGSVISKNNYLTSSSSINPNLSNDYNSYKVALSYGRTLRRSLNLYVGGFYVFNGRNTGQGLGGNVNLILKLP